MQLRKTFSLRMFLIGLSLSGFVVVVMMHPLIQYRAEQSALKTLKAPIERCDSYDPGRA